MVLDHVGLMIGVTGDSSSQARASAWHCRGVGSFLKEFVKLNCFPLGWCVTLALGVVACFYSLLVAVNSWAVGYCIFLDSSQLAGELLEKSADLLRLRRNPSSLSDVAVFIAKADGDLSCMLNRFRGTTSFSFSCCPLVS